MNRSTATATDEPTPRAADERRLVVLSNRLPVTWQPDGSLQLSSGGLAAALAGVPRDERLTWIGWLGDHVPEAQRDEVARRLAAWRLQPVFLTRAQGRLYYQASCNEVLWPLCHYFVARVHFRAEAWAEYVRVNELFAEAALAACAGQPATVWVHDFHLMLVPQMLRARRPDLAIGFFLHIPFPSSEVYRLLPVREQVLEGLLGADAIAFHTADYALHFRHTCLRVLGLPSGHDEIEFEGRRVAIGVHPVGPDVETFLRLVDDPATAAHLAELRTRFAGRKLVLGVERLDYSKGVPLKLDTFERYLEQDPGRAKTTTLLQVVVPSRSNHPEYQQLKNKIEQRVAEINGRFADPGIVPVEYAYRSLPAAELTALYRFADVAMVTPMRDGMNLVAQEYVLCQRDLHGILLLSEFTGAAHLLSRAILVNPWDVERTARALDEALRMPGGERRARMLPMQRRVEQQGCRQWAESCLASLAQAAAQRGDEGGQAIDQAAFAAIVERAQAAPYRHLFLDYDGTLRELAPTPELAVPSLALRDLLAALATLPQTSVHIVSGRDRATIGEWLGDLPLHLCAEHGYAIRAPLSEWVVPDERELSWLCRVQRVLEQLAEDVPHTFVETKAASIAWHYRLADLDWGSWRARELQHNLEQLLANEPAEVLLGRAVVEVRAAGIHKGRYARRVLADAPDSFVLAMGDDRTDNDLFRALDDSAVTIQIGARQTLNARYALPSPAAARALLHRLLAAWQ